MPLRDLACISCSVNVPDYIVRADEVVRCPSCGEPMTHGVDVPAPPRVDGRSSTPARQTNWSDYKGQLGGSASDAAEVHYDVARRSGITRDRAAEISRDAAEQTPVVAAKLAAARGTA